MVIRRGRGREHPQPTFCNTTKGKKRRKKPDMRRTYFRIHVTSGQKVSLGRRICVCLFTMALKDTAWVRSLWRLKTQPGSVHYGIKGHNLSPFTVALTEKA
jgi:hypothetical protein